VLTLSSVVAASGDSIGTRTARFVLGSFVPVVGGALSEAFTTAQSCLNMVRSCTGVYAIIAVAVLFLPVMVRLICWYIAAGISSIIAALLGVDSIGRLMKSMGTAIGILLAMLLCFMLILLVTFTLVLMLGQGMS
jgi:stage III sporulation protein AE